MYNSCTDSKQKINLTIYRDKVLGCWTGKNIGGTLGAPFEGCREMNDVMFYTEDFGGKPAPNDDLDLQLIWLLAVEENGLFRLNERILGEYWLSHITGPWNEYGVCKANIRNGLIPPLSGSCNNDRWKYSNGAWIRSEIWSCLFPGSPDKAAQFAYYDSCCDHCGEGIYAEIFTATMEAVAFIINDVREIIKIALSRIPIDCRIARSIKLACKHYDDGCDFKTARKALVKDSEDLGWFQAPANIGFVIIGLLYGEGDFGKSVCLANNCGDDTDCTAGTVGAIMGILLGRSGIPQKWIEPIGETIQTCAIDTYGRNNLIDLPKTLDELTDRIVRIAVVAQQENAMLPQLVAGLTEITKDYRKALFNAEWVSNHLWNKSPYELVFELPYARLIFDYDNGPYIVPGEIKRITVKISHIRFIEKLVSVKLLLPEGWTSDASTEVILNAKHSNVAEMEVSFVPDKFNSAYYYLPVKVQICDRLNPIVVNIPLQQKKSVDLSPVMLDEDFFDAVNRHKNKRQI